MTDELGLQKRFPHRVEQRRRRLSIRAASAYPYLRRRKKLSENMA
ncbi:MAG: hypothetical protein L6V79_05785 [Clostridium sp.]|nr:MAG: hypothetical protein L6V79_05785 [Clostridium sp.]